AAARSGTATAEAAGATLRRINGRSPFIPIIQVDRTVWSIDAPQRFIRRTLWVPLPSAAPRPLRQRSPHCDGSTADLVADVLDRFADFSTRLADAMLDLARAPRLRSLFFGAR